MGEEWVQRRRGSAPARPGRLFPRPPLHLLLLYTPGPHPEHGATPSSVHHSRNADTPCRHAMCMRQPFPRELAAATARHRAPVAGARPREWPSIRHLAPRGALPIRVWSVLSLLGMGLLPVGRTKNGHSVSRHRESSSSEFRAPQTSNETKRSLALQSCSAPTAWRPLSTDQHSRSALRPGARHARRDATRGRRTAGEKKDALARPVSGVAQRGSARCSPLRLASHSQITISRAVIVSHMCRLRLTARKGLMPRSCSIDCFRDLLRAACSPPGHPSRRGRTRPKACDQPNRTHQHNDARSQATAA